MSDELRDSSVGSDPTNPSLPECPRCGTPVARVTTTGPETHHTSCGCRLTLGEVNRL